MTDEKTLIKGRGVKPFHVMSLLSRAQQLEAQGASIIHLEVGEPDFGTPAPIVAAAKAALDLGLTRYTPALGISELRAAIAQYYQDQGAVSVSAERIAVTAGASGALQLALAACTAVGEEVLLTDPGYPANANIVQALGMNARCIAVSAASKYQFTQSMLAAHRGPRTAAVLIASPANPTGTLIDTAELERIGRWASAAGIGLIVDEIYRELVFDDRLNPSAAGLFEQALIIGSFSKTYNMTGWRLGWLVAPHKLVPSIERLAQNLFLSPSSIAQHAALAAFTPSIGEIVAARRDELAKRRDYLVPALIDLGFEVPVMPDGAFYIYAGCSRFTDDSYCWCQQLLERIGVALAPGIDFGSHEGARHVRIAYTQPITVLREAVSRLQAVLV